jgi:hypothetical protein
VEIFLPDEHKKLLTVAIRSRMVQTEAQTEGKTEASTGHA